MIREKIDIEIIKERVENLCERLELIERNHLPHIQEELTSIKLRMAYYTGAGIVILAVTQFLVNWLFK